MTSRFFALALLGVSLCACGYHLRGTAVGDWSLGAIYLRDEQAHALAAEVRRQLEQGGVNLVAEAAAADTLLTLSGESYDRRVLSVDPDTGKVREYELGLSAYLSVAAADGRVLLEREPIVLQRDYVFEEGTALGKFAEEEALQGDLRADAAAAVLRRLRAVARGTRPRPAAP